MMKRKSANLYQKCSILRSMILLNVLHNVSLTVLLPWRPTGFQTSPILKAFLATFSVPFSYMYMYLQMVLYKCVSSCLWLHLTFFELKITNILKSGGWGLEHSELPWEQNFYSRRCVSCKTVSLPSFNLLRDKLAKIALFIYLR